MIAFARFFRPRVSCTLGPSKAGYYELTRLFGFLRFEDADDLEEHSFSLAGDGAFGAAVVNADGSYTYTPEDGFVGADVFYFTVSDGAASDTVSVVIDVYNTAPEADSATETLYHDDDLVSSVTGTDANGDTLTFVLVAGPANGSLAISADGTYTYTPNTGYVGDDSFEFLADDGAEGAFATVAITVEGPTATGETVELAQDESISAMLSGDDPDGHSVDFAIISQPAGEVTQFVPADGTFDYEPESGFAGSDSLQFIAEDGAAHSEPTQFIFQVDAEDLPEVAVSLQSEVAGFTKPNRLFAETKPGSLEGDDLVFAVTVTLPAGVNVLPQAITVDYKTQDGAATTTNSDYTDTNGTLTFAAGANGAGLTKLVHVKTTDDADVEANEDLSLRLTKANGGRLTTARADALILNNDVDVTPRDAFVDENKGPVAVEFGVDGADSARMNGLLLEVVGHTSDGGAKVSDNDYVAETNDSRTLSADEHFVVFNGRSVRLGTSSTSITIKNDFTHELTEDFYYSLDVGEGTSAKAQIHIQAGSAKIEIKDDDP